MNKAGEMTVLMLVNEKKSDANSHTEEDLTKKEKETSNLDRKAGL